MPFENSKPDLAESIASIFDNMLEKHAQVSSLVTVYSRNPLYYINNKMEIEQLDNVYSDKEIVRININEIDHLDVKRGKTITLCPFIGMIFFDSIKDVNKFISIYQLDVNCFIDNSKTFNRLKASNQSITIDNDDVGKIKSGIYSLSDMDNEITGKQLRRMCYITPSNKIERITQISETDPLLAPYLGRYILLNKQLENFDCINNRLIFEIYEAGDRIYINHTFMNSTRVEYGKCLFYTDILGYPMFMDKESANEYLINSRLHNSSHAEFIDHRQHIDEYRNYVKTHNQRYKIAVMSCIRASEFIWNWKGKGSIMNYGKKIFDKAIETFKKGEDPTMLNTGEVFDLVNISPV